MPPRGRISSGHTLPFALPATITLPSSNISTAVASAFAPNRLIQTTPTGSTGCAACMREPSRHTSSMSGPIPRATRIRRAIDTTSPSIAPPCDVAWHGRIGLARPALASFSRRRHRHQLLLSGGSVLTGSTLKLRSRVQVPQAPSTRARTFQVQPTAFASTMYPPLAMV